LFLGGMVVGMDHTHLDDDAIFPGFADSGALRGSEAGQRKNGNYGYWPSPMRGHKPP
jgi:hypothetical protein